MRRPDREARVVCGECGFEFRPAYSDGRCPLCGWIFGGEIPRGRLERAAHWLRRGANGLLVGLALLAVVYSALFFLVLWVYWRG